MIPDTFLPLTDLGPRICILGPSNSGKSTLALAIAEKTDSPVVHLDQLFHQPGTRWQERPEAEFLALHESAVQQERWVMEGNYTRYLGSRLARATGLIMLDISMPVMLRRYFYRTLIQKDRAGNVLPAGLRDRLSKEMLKYLLVVTPGKRVQNRTLYQHCSLPKVFLASPAQTAACRQQWQLTKR